MSNIKINDVPQRVQYSATNGQTQFAIPFPFFSNNYVYVWQDGIQLSLGAAPGEYGISGVGSPSGGLITLVTPATLNSIITIQGVMPIDRTSIYSATISNLTGSDLNGDFNREVVMMKQIETTQAYLQLQYAPWAEVSQDLSVTKDRYLPLLAPNEVWMMASDGSEIIGTPLPDLPPSPDAPYVVYEDSPTTPSAFNLGSLTSGLLKQTVALGVATPEIALLNTDYYGPGMSPLPIAEGGTNADNAADARTNLGLGTMAVQDANNVNISGGNADLTSGTVSDAPVSATDIVNKAYADSIAAGFNLVNPVNAASTGDFTSTYNNGSSGVGATLTATSNGAFSLDGQAGVLNANYLMKNQSSTFQNGIYTLTQVGDGSNPAILTRATGFDTPAEIQPGDMVPVLAGTTNGSTFWVQTATVATIGTDPISFVQFGAAMVPLNVASGGTGLTSFTVNAPIFGGSSATGALQQTAALTNGQLLIGSTGNLPTPATLTAGNGISIANGAGSIGVAITDFVPFTAWTPTITFDTPGDLSVSYATRVGAYSRIGPIVLVNFSITCTPTFTTASGNLRISNLPVANNATANNSSAGSVTNSVNITYAASRTALSLIIDAGNSYINVYGIGSNVARAAIGTTSIASGAAFTLFGSIMYLA